MTRSKGPILPGTMNYKAIEVHEEAPKKYTFKSTTQGKQGELPLKTRKKGEFQMVEGQLKVPAPDLTSIYNATAKALPNGCTEILIETSDIYYYTVVTKHTYKNKKNRGKVMGK